jgi:hypothetical protein
MEKLQREADGLKQQAETKQKEAKKIAMGIQVRGLKIRDVRSDG